MKKSITKNYIYNLVYQILVLILPLITAPYVSRVLGPENIGIYSYTISVTTYFILFGSLGIAMYGQREIAYNQSDPEKYSKIFWELIIFRFVTMSFSMIIFYFNFVKSTQYGTYYAILLLELLANCLDVSWFFQGLEEFKKTVTRNVIVKFITIVSIFTFVKTQNDLSKYFWIYVLSTVIGNISLWLYLPKILKKVKIKELNVYKHIKPNILLFIPQIATQIYTVLDKVMIGSIISNKSEVGYYEQSQKIVKMLLTIVTSLGTVMMPRMANTFVKGEKEKILEYLQNSFNFVFFIATPMMFGTIAISNNFVPIFFGPGYEKVSLLMSVISPIFIMIGLSNVIGTQYLLPTKKQKQFTISVVIGAIVNFFINIILIRKFGSIGASVATVIAESIVTIVQLIFIRKDINIKIIFEMASKYVVSAILMFIVCIMIGTMINDKICAIISQVIAGIVIYLLCLIVLKDRYIYIILNKIKQKISQVWEIKNE